MIVQLMEELEITIPIVWVKGKEYLIGSKIFTLEIRQDHLKLLVGPIWENFDEYVAKNHRQF